MTVNACAAQMLASSSAPLYPPLVEGGALRWYEDFRYMATTDSSQNIAVGPPLPVKSKILYGLLKWSALGANTSLQVGDASSSNRFKKVQSTSSASCEANQRFDGLDVGGIWGVQPGSGAVNFGADTVPNTDLFGYTTCQ